MAANDETLILLALAALDDDLKNSVPRQFDAKDFRKKLKLAMQIQLIRATKISAYYTEELCRKT